MADLGGVVMVEELAAALCWEGVGLIMTDVWVITDGGLLSDWLLMGEVKTPNFVVDAKCMVELTCLERGKLLALDMVLFGGKRLVNDAVFGVKLLVIDIVFGDG
jgi:hypothetical protein